jgi:glucuronate isomerase
MSLDLRQRLFNELDQLVLVDPHTHINQLDPGSHTLADILGYHYYTELAHSAGMPKERIEEPGIDPKEKVRRLIENLGPVQNTIQYSWLVEMCQTFFGLQGDQITPDNWEAVYDTAERLMGSRDWPQQVLKKSRLEAVFLTNDFDDPLEGFDPNVYIPCLRTDDLVFHLAKPEVRQRLEKATKIAPTDARFLRRGIAALFQHFKSRGARACAISLPPDFSPQRVSLARANTALAAILAEGVTAAESHRKAIGNYVFWTLAEMCEAFKLPFDLMVGVNRGVYEAGVHQGRDLYDSRVSLIQYKELFNSFPRVTFPISVLASVTNQELTSYAWIFPNVVSNGHWWYSNTPAFIEHDLAARLEAVPRTKQIGYYSDMYKLEFGQPKFAMFKRILAKVLAERFVIDRRWSEEQAISLGTQVLRGNVESIFRWGEDMRKELPGENELEPLSTNAPLGPISPTVAAEAISISHPVPFESEIVKRLPDPPVKPFVRPVPEQSSGEDLRLAGASGNEPPELEVIENPDENA